MGPEKPGRRLKTAMAPVVWAIMEVISRDPNDSGGIETLPTPQIPSAKFRLKSSRLDFLGSRWHSHHWLSSKGPNYQRRLLLTSAGAIEGHFEGKTRRERVSCSCMTMPRLNWAHATKKKTVYLVLQCPDHTPYTPDQAQSDYHLFTGLKNNGMVAVFVRIEVIAAAGPG